MACSCNNMASVGKTKKGKRKSKVGALDAIPIALIGGAIAGKVGIKKVMDMDYVKKVEFINKNPMVKNGLLLIGGAFISQMDGEFVEGLGIGVALEGAEGILSNFLKPKPTTNTNTTTNTSVTTTTSGGGTDTGTDTNAGTAGVGRMRMLMPDGTWRTYQGGTVPQNIAGLFDANGNLIYQGGSYNATIGSQKVKVL